MKAFSNPEKVEKAIEKSLKKLPEPDQILLQDIKFRDLMIEEAKEAFLPGLEGALLDGKLYTKPWGFELKDISPDLQVYLWHGELDVNVHVSMGRKMCELIPKCQGKFYPNEAHLSLAINNIGEILDTLKS
jgi:hypothetical protein